MLYEIKSDKELNIVKPFFKNIRFFIGNSVFDGMKGNAYVDNTLNPKLAVLTVNSFCFISGTIEKIKLKNIIDKYFKNYDIIPSDNLAKEIEEIYQDNIIKSYRYSIKKNPHFDILKLEQMANNLDTYFKIIEIDKKMTDRIKKEEFIRITDNYEEDGIGYCCLTVNNELVGVASSNIIYKDGIEVNIKVKEQYRRKKIATAMASKLILECLKQKRKISWDAANTNSVVLAEKLGFKYDSKYNVYSFDE